MKQPISTSGHKAAAKPGQVIEKATAAHFGTKMLKLKISASFSNWLNA